MLFMPKYYGCFIIRYTNDKHFQSCIVYVKNALNMSKGRPGSATDYMG